MKKEKKELWDGYTKEEKILIANTLDKYSKFVKTKIPQNTNFLNPYEVKMIESILIFKKIPYQIYSISEDCEQRVLMFGEIKEPITIYSSILDKEITHSDILGTLFSIGYEPGLIGDIFVLGNYFYLTNLSRMNSFLEEHLVRIKGYTVTLKKVEQLPSLSDRYSVFSLIVSSRRIDHIVSLLAKKSRAESVQLLKKGNVLLNYRIVEDGTTQVADGDIFSIRHVGKFHLNKGLKKTRKEKEVVEIWKYR